MPGSNDNLAARSNALQVVHLIDSGGFFGAEQVVVTLAAEQQARGKDVTIATIVAPQDDGNPIGEVADARGLSVKEFLMRDGFNVAGRNEILKWLADETVEVLHCHGFKPNILMGLVPRRRRTCQYITTLHGWTSTDKWNKHRVVEFVERLLLPRFDKVCFVSESMFAKVPALIRKRLHCSVVPNGVDVQIRGTELPEDIRLFAAGRRIVVALGRLSVEKDFSMLLRAMAIVLASASDVCVVIVGEGSLRAELQHEAKHLGIDRSVMFAGYRDQPREWLAQCDVFALTSVTEGLPMVVLEAMVAGLPIAATRVGELPTVLSNLPVPLIEPGDHAAMARRLDDLLNRGSGTYDSTMLLERVSSTYSNQAMADAYDEVYFGALSRMAA